MSNIVYGILVILAILGGYMFYNSLDRSDTQISNSLSMEQVKKPEEKEEKISEKVSYSKEYVIEVFTTESCSCCLKWVEYLKRNRINVKVNYVESSIINEQRKRMKIPMKVHSCHLSKVGDYYLEGHVPISAIDYIMAKKPDWIGISLPKVKAGVPGMEGTSFYNVLAISKTGQVKPVFKYQSENLIKEYKDEKWRTEKNPKCQNCKN